MKQSAPRHDVVDMGMVLKSSAPGVKDPEEAGEIGADVLWICGEFFDGIRGGLEQSGVTEALVLAHERAQLFWDGEGDQKVMTRELAFELFLEPLLGFVVLAGGAVAIAAGAQELLRLGAVLTLIERDTAGLGTAGDQSIDDFLVRLGILVA